LFITRAKGGKLTIYDYVQEIIVWERIFAEECAYTDPFRDKAKKGEIDKIYLYNEEQLIVTTKYSYSFCFNINTGQEIWKSPYLSKIEIVNNIGYAYSNGGSIAKIDLNTGKILSNDGQFFHLPDLPPVQHKTLGEIHISTKGDLLIHHNGLLWYVVYSNGYSFIVAINPHDWHYEWIHQVETNEKVMDIKFHENRMYLYDTGNVLHVYDKIEPFI